MIQNTLAFAFVLSIVLIVVIPLASALTGGRRRRHLDILEKAVLRDDVAPDQRRELIALLQQELRRPPAFSWSKLVVGAGWLGMFGGVLYASTQSYYDAEIDGGIFAVMSFAVMTLPFVMTEVDKHYRRTRLRNADDSGQADSA